MLKKRSNLVLKILALLFCIYIFHTAWENREITKTQWSSYCSDEIDFAAFVDNVSSGFMNSFFDKNKYIDLNGLYVRLTGQITDNDVVRLNDGMLTAETMSEVDMTPKAESVIGLSDYLDDSGIEFLYVQAPDKMDLQKTILPSGIVNFSNENADQLLAYLRDADVETLDLRPYICATAEMTETYFYSTDHHWNPLGAFVAFQHISEYIQQMFPGSELDASVLDPRQWELHTKENWFLGSRGKRVGIYFGGVDDLLWLTPRFDTEISCLIPYSNQFYKGDFTEANIRAEYYGSDEPEYFDKTAYCVYIGGDYGIVQHRNSNAASDIKVLIIKDSFALPVQAYLSVAFQEVDVIDLRHYTADTLVGYIEDAAPDIVVMMLYPGSFTTDEHFVYGIEDKADEASQEDEIEFISLIKNDQACIDGSELKKGYYALTENLEANTTYRLTFEKASFLCGNDRCITASLYDAGTDKDIQLKLFDTDFCNENGGYSWIFTTPEAENSKLQLVVYPGLIKGTEEKNDEEKNILEIVKLELDVMKDK